MNIIDHAGSIEMIDMVNQYKNPIFNKIEYPVCDNCSKPIFTFGKHILKGAYIIYVHDSYDNETGKCNEI